MAEHTPHFQRCVWCASYFEVPAETGEDTEKPCCPRCAVKLPAAESPSSNSKSESFGDTGLASFPPYTVDILDYKVIWTHCPVCYKAILPQLSEPDYQSTNFMGIHLQHMQEEQRQLLLSLQRRWQSSLQDSLDTGDSQVLTNRLVMQSQAVKDYSLKAHYPDNIDCNQLFWYSHTLR